MVSKNDDNISLLEALLKDAHAGRLECVIVAAVLTDGRILAAWTSEASRAERVMMLELLKDLSQGYNTPVSSELQ